jgi:hypothetical protein
MLLAEVARVLEETAVVEVAHVMAALAAETSTQEATAALDSTALHVEDADDQTALVEREALEMVLRVEVENAMALVSAHEDAEGLVRKIALLEGEHAEVRHVQKLAEENSCGLFDAVNDVECRWEVSERECRMQFEELTLLPTRGSELCLTIVGPPRVRNHLS